MAGGKQEDAAQREREEQLRELERELHREQQNRFAATDTNESANDDCHSDD